MRKGLKKRLAVLKRVNDERRNARLEKENAVVGEVKDGGEVCIVGTCKTPLRVDCVRCSTCSHVSILMSDASTNTDATSCVARTSAIRNNQDKMAKMTDAECELAQKSFADMTDTDAARARSFLQDFNWQFQDALDAYFEGSPSRPNDGNDKKSSETTSEADLFEIQSEAPSTSKKKAIVTVMKRVDPPPPSSLGSFTVLSWNVDGLADDEDELMIRISAICDIILKVSAEAVFLQELTSMILPEVRQTLGGAYRILVANPYDLYFTGVLLKRNVEYISHLCLPFGFSRMGREMQMVEAKFKGMRVRLLNTHLESLKDSSDIRQDQLQQCFKQLTKWDDGHSFIILAGDLNIRDFEVSNIPQGFRDAWIEGGSDNKTRFSWDTSINDNNKAGGPKCRFDRIYYNGGGVFSRVDFSFEGTQRVRFPFLLGNRCFPSDHFALVARFH